MAAVEEKVKQIIVDQLGVEATDVTPAASFVDDLGADSLDRVELVMALEGDLWHRDTGRGCGKDRYGPERSGLHPEECEVGKAVTRPDNTEFSKTQKERQWQQPKTK